MEPAPFGYLTSPQIDQSGEEYDLQEHAVPDQTRKITPPALPALVPSFARQEMLAPLRGIENDLPNQWKNLITLKHQLRVDIFDIISRN